MEAKVKKRTKSSSPYYQGLVEEIKSLLRPFAAASGTQLYYHKIGFLKRK
jgi:hypothetical protein